tara:strand:+ start:10689 stop:11351 length:663 start_codon:yes stop_codon:yes gene_type:complete
VSLNKVLITGSSGGLGYHLTEFFLKKGYPVIIHGRDEKKIISIVENFTNEGFNIEYFICDLNNENDIYSLSEFCKSKDVKILINNAGVICPSLEFKKITNDVINQMIKVNLIAPISLINFLQYQLEQVININSMVGKEPKASRTIYAASKWGLRGFSDSLKKENVDYNILDVYPTNIKTWPERENAMDINFVLEMIYNAMLENKKELVLDGRKNDFKGKD